MQRVEIHYLPTRLKGDPGRSMLRFFWPGSERVRHTFERLMALDGAAAQEEVDNVFHLFGSHHVDLEGLLRQNAREAAARLQVELPDDRFRELLLGAFTSMEYSIEAAALFNPSMILAPDQNGLQPEQIRFLMSMRAVGEGHISSIILRHGTISADGELTLPPPLRLARAVQPVPNPRIRRAELEAKLRQMNKLHPGTQAVLDELGEYFTYERLLAVLNRSATTSPGPAIESVQQLVVWMAKSAYKVQVPPARAIDEFVLFPLSEAESHGVEDMRLVRLADDNGQTLICGTYTAFSGNKILPQMMIYRPGENEILMATLLGRFARDKGLALFPRKVAGRYRMLGRCDGENHYLLSSDEIDFWDEGVLLAGPAATWEIVQVGNCGSPIETPRGWLVLTHGVGSMRRYCIGAMLLDLEDPSRVIARLGQPLLEPQKQEEGGYVPNVVYSCGGMVHGDRLFIPYGISDTAVGFAWVSLDELLHAMR